MKMRFTVFIFLSLFAVTVHAQDRLFNIIFHQDFEKTSTGVYDPNEWKRDWGSPAYANNLEHTYIVTTDGGNKAMKWVYPKGSVGPSQGGGQFEYVIHPGTDEIYMSYNIKFKPGFNWAQGGKLPGLRGGPDKYGAGHKPGWDEGFSNGLMWGHGYGGMHDQGGLYFYTYFQDQTGKYGDSFRWGTFTFQTDPERWYNVTIRMVMNTVKADGSGGNDDGIMEGFIDGRLVVSKTGMRFRNVSSIHIDKMKIYSFFGGSGPEYAARRDEWVLLDDVYLFTYARGVNVPKGNQPSLPGSVLQLPNLNKTSKSSAVQKIPLKIPSGVQARNNTSDSLKIRRKPISDKPNVTGNRVNIDNSEAGTTRQPGFKAERPDTSSSYLVSVSALEASAKESPKSPPIIIPPSEPDHEAPSVPAGIAVTGQYENEIDLSWKPSSDNVRVAGYHVFVNGTEYSNSAFASVSLKRLLPDTDYEIAVSAYDAMMNESGRSEAIKIKTEVADSKAPSAPEGLRIVKITSREVSVSWNPSTDNEKVAGYVIFLDGQVRGTAFGTSYVIKGLIPGTDYKITIAAFDARSNKSESSEPVDVTTPETKE